ncbi:uncharacterized protein MONBRDRAFT_34306 [Monosiga brevicollis MX1]|uniref:Staphylococcus aureus surface protein A n=1 Tax=Monosiga brevicollis TaxID=81824 RepID=A9VAU4_MONBE|nr:uncharacterized protein MONBRDRAFT_34306 [Monosiga brevicollis MX1]EDQ85436.1 predicted protein [Monosiga brevicollis MX1]|eukprot:XP_001749847.1 hypothetical protein [Monosiga brevicollis MX1]
MPPGSALRPSWLLTASCLLLTAHLGVADIVTEQVATYIDLDGSNDAVRMPDLTLTTDLTLELVVQFRDKSADSYNRVMEIRNEDGEYLGILRDQVRNGRPYFEIAYKNSLDGTTTMYYNGTRVGNIVLSSGYSPGTFTDNFLGGAISSNNMHNGLIALFRIYTTALSASQAQTLYSSGTLHGVSPFLSYTFDDQCGTTVDDIIGPNDGSFVGFPLWKTTKPRALDDIRRTGVSFIEPYDQIQLPALTYDASNGNTFEAVFRFTDELSNYDRLLYFRLSESEDTGVSILKSNADYGYALKFEHKYVADTGDRIAPGALSTRVASELGIWQHLLVRTFPSGLVEMFINGSLVASTTLPKPIPTYTFQTPAIGSAWGGTAVHNGDIARVSIFNQPLSDSEMRQVFELERTPDVFDKLLYRWDMREAVGTTTADFRGGMVGQFFGKPRWFSDKIASRLEAVSDSYLGFDGNDRVKLEPITLGDTFAIEMVYRFRSLVATGYNRLLELKVSPGADDHIAILRRGSEDYRLYFEAKRTKADGTFAYPTIENRAPQQDTNWHHLLVIKNKNEGRLIIDGSLVSVNSDMPHANNVYQSVCLGSKADGTSAFKGDIALARIYNRALSDAEIQGLYRTSAYRSQKVLYAGFSLASPSAFRAAVNSYEMDEAFQTFPPRSVMDSISSKTYSFLGAPSYALTDHGCPRSQLIKVTIEAGSGTYDATETAVWMAIMDEDGRNDYINAFSEGFLSSEVLVAHACLQPGKTFQGLTLRATSDDGFMPGLVIAEHDVAYVWKTTWSSALETDGTAERSLHISESVVSQAEHCTNAQIAVDVTTVTMTGTYADTRNEVTMVVTGTQGASDVMSLGQGFSLGESRKLTRCVPKSIGTIVSFTLTLNKSDDGWLLGTFEADYDDGSGTDMPVTWNYYSWLKQSTTTDSQVTFSLSDHTNINTDNCPASRFVIISAISRDSTAGGVFATLTGTLGSAATIRLAHAFGTSNDNVLFARCLDRPIGNFVSMTLSTSPDNQDGWGYGGASLTFQGSLFQWPSRSVTLSPSNPKLVLQASETVTNPANINDLTTTSCEPNPCDGGTVCTQPSRTWHRVYQSDFSMNNDGWLADNVQTQDAVLSPVTCGSLGPVLGITQMAATSVLSRTTTQLPPHNLLRVVLTIIKADSFDNEAIFLEVDGVRVHSETYSGDQGTAECGADETYSRELQIPIDITLPHTDAQVTLVVSSTLDSSAEDESFGVQAAALWVANDTLTPFVKQTFEDNNFAGWSAINTYHGNALSVTACGDYGQILGGYEQLGLDAMLTRCLSNMPAHSELLLEIDVLAIDSFDKENIVILLDGEEIWDSGAINRETHPLGSFQCGRGSVSNPDQYWWRDVEIPVRLLVPHSKSNAQIVVKSTIDGEANDESFAIKAFQVATLATDFFCGGQVYTPPSPDIALPKTPLASYGDGCSMYPDYRHNARVACSSDMRCSDCSLNYAWQQVDFQDFTDMQVHGWTSTFNPGCNGLTVSSCGIYGAVLGGANQLMRGATISKTWTNLPTHSKVLIELEVLTIDSWDNEHIMASIDGKPVYTSVPINRGSAFPGQQACGWNLGAAYTRESPIVLRFEVYHTASSMTLLLTSDLSHFGIDESWGLSQYRISTANTPIAFDATVVAQSSATEFARLWESTGSKTLGSCDATSVLQPSSVSDQIFVTMTNLVPHDLLELTLTISGADATVLTVTLDDLVFIAVFGVRDVVLKANASPLECACAAGTFLSRDGACSVCDTTCAECSDAGPSACSACHPGEYLQAGGCLACSECSGNTFLQQECTADQDAICEDCPVACALCTGTTALDCRVKSAPMVLFCLTETAGPAAQAACSAEGRICVTGCLDGYYADNSTMVRFVTDWEEGTFHCLEQCPAHFYSNQGTWRCSSHAEPECLMCDSSCQACANATQCLSCHSGYEVSTGGLCTPITPKPDGNAASSGSASGSSSNSGASQGAMIAAICVAVLALLFAAFVYVRSSRQNHGVDKSFVPTGMDFKRDAIANPLYSDGPREGMNPRYDNQESMFHNDANEDPAYSELPGMTAPAFEERGYLDVTGGAGDAGGYGDDDAFDGSDGDEPSYLHVAGNEQDEDDEPGTQFDEFFNDLELAEERERNDIELLLEAERRGLLDENCDKLLSEARRRGLAPPAPGSGEPLERYEVQYNGSVSLFDIPMHRLPSLDEVQGGVRRITHNPRMNCESILLLLVYPDVLRVYDVLDEPELEASARRRTLARMASMTLRKFTGGRRERRSVDRDNFNLDQATLVVEHMRESIRTFVAYNRTVACVTQDRDDITGKDKYMVHAYRFQDRRKAAEIANHLRQSHEGLIERRELREASRMPVVRATLDRLPNTAGDFGIGLVGAKVKSEATDDLAVGLQVIKINAQSVEDYTMAECRDLLRASGDCVVLDLQENPHGFSLYQYRAGSLRPQVRFGTDSNGDSQSSLEDLMNDMKTFSSDANFTNPVTIVDGRAVVMDPTKAAPPPTATLSLQQLITSFARNAVFTPINNVRTLIQIGYETRPEIKSHSIWGTPGFRRASLYQYCKDLYAAHGYYGLFCGWFPRAFSGVIFDIVNKNVADRLWITQQQSNGDKNTLRYCVTHIGIDIVAGSIAALVTQPLRVIATRTVAQMVAGEDLYGNIFQSIAYIINHEGWQGLWSGISAKLTLEVVRATAVGLILYAIRKTGIVRNLLTDNVSQMANINVSTLTDVYENTAAVSIGSYIFHPFDVIATMLMLQNSGLTLARSPFLPLDATIHGCWTFLRTMDGNGGRGLRRGASNLSRFYKTPCPAFTLTTALAM